MWRIPLITFQPIKENEVTIAMLAATCFIFGILKGTGAAFIVLGALRSRIKEQNKVIEHMFRFMMTKSSGRDQCVFRGYVLSKVRSNEVI